MRTLLLITTTVLLLLVNISDSDLVQKSETQQHPNEPLRNFYSSYEEHKQHIDRILHKCKYDNDLVFVNDSVINVDDDHKIRHRHHHADEHKIKKLARCRRYAQNYYDSSIIIRPNCYYNRCRQSYCGYCPTSSCRRRCPSYNCSIQDTTTTRRPYYSCNCDPHGSQFDTCNANGKCICKDHFTGQKCDTCEDTFRKFNTECVPCHCDPNGSKSNVCDKETGQCHCKEGIGGERCNACLAEFYGNVTAGCKACDPCNKEGHICDPNNGKCVCPPRTVGKKCEKCAKDSWGYEPGIGCKACDCSHTGSTKADCVFVSGICTCRPGFEGEKCNRCLRGWFGYPHCKKCNCHKSGTLAEDCEEDSCVCSKNGCRCKPNVEGPKCDRCKEGTFGIDRDNPLGCRDCFCFGRSKKCHSGEYTWEEIRTNQVVHDICINNKPCLKLPEKFTGDLTLSYGGYLSIISSSFLSTFYEVFINGNGIVLKSTMRDAEIKLNETNFELVHENNKHIRLPRNCHGQERLTRACIMVVLQNVTKINILPGPSFKSAEFIEVALQTASNKIPGDLPVTTIEFCECPKEYTSASCQDPNSGYYRYRPPKVTPENYIDGLIGIAKPCECNGRSRTCDRETGHCTNCTDFTMGAHCELCAEGYYKDLRGNCSPCLCPSERHNFAMSCTVTGKKHNKFTCHCKEGYTGAKCEKCDNEYWGNPLADGFCKACNCNPHGSESPICDKMTGACKCRLGFSGKLCSTCLSPREAIQNGVCTPCDECTQILFNTIDNLSEGLNSTFEMFKDGIGPPWPILNETLYRYNLLSKKYTDNFEKGKKLINEANIDELEEKVNDMKRDVEKKKIVVGKQMKTIGNLESDSKNISSQIERFKNKIDNIIKNLNGFGNSHVDTKKALKEARQILKEITEKSKTVPTPQDFKKFFIQCHEIYNKVTDIYNNNDLNPDELRLKLNELKKRLGNFNLILDQTDLIAKLAKNKTKQNANRLAKLNHTISEINANNTVTNENLKDIFEKIERTNEILTDLQQIYSELARLDLEKATKPLVDNEVDDSQYEIVNKVADHVKDLQDKIKRYKNMFNFTDAEWKKINASAAYDNLIKGIEEARLKGQEAENIIVDASKLLNPPNDDSLADKTNLAKALSDRLKQRITNLQNPVKEFNKVREALEKLKYDILNNGRNNNDLITALQNLRQQINRQDINMDRLEKVKEDARRVTDEMVHIENKVKNLNITTQYELIKSYHIYLNLTSNDEISRLMDKITVTRQELQGINPHKSYFNTIKNASHVIFKSNQSNLEALRLKIKSLNEKIQYAKEAADSINIAISIANCERIYHVQEDVLKSLSLTYKCTNCQLITLQNSKNETIKINAKESKGEHIITVRYKNRERIKLKGSLRVTNRIKITRLGFNIVFESDSDKKLLYDKYSFKLDEGDHLKVGNQSNANKSNACLHKIELNDNVIGLWKFTSTKGDCPGCQKETNASSTNVFFGGNGYRNVTGAKEIKATQFNFQFTFVTFDEDSLIWLAQEKANSCAYLSLSLKDGHLLFKARHQDGTSAELMLTEAKYNTGRPVTVDIRMVFGGSTQTYVLQADVKNKTMTQLLRSNVFKIKKSHIFIGGIPVVFDTSCLEVTNTSFLGYLQTSDVAFSDAALTTSYNTRLTTTDELNFDKAWFSGEGFLKLRLKEALKLPASLNFIFRPVSTNGFIMRVGPINIYVKNNRLVVNINDNVTTIKNELTEINVVDMNITKDYVDILINDDFNPKHIPIPPDTFPEDLTEIDLGEDPRKLQPHFKGGISSIVINNTLLISFNKDSVRDFEKVEIGRERPVKSSSKLSVKNAIISATDSNNVRDNMQNTEGCPLIANYETDPDAVKFGDKANSFIFIENSFWKKDYELEFQFRTFYTNGLLFISTGAYQQKHFNVLEIQDGRLKLRVKGKKMKTIISSGKVNDGVWHHVQIKQTGLKKKRKFSIALDGVLIKKPMRMPKNKLKAELYVGGVPESFPIYMELRNEVHPFRGCMRSLKINNDLQVLVKNKKSVSYNNIGQCFPSVERGAYFGGDAYAIYKADFKVNKVLELSFEFRTAEQNGILLSVSNFGNSPALSVELQNGAVVMTIDMGNGAVSNVTNRVDSDFTLCNNRWHNITALYSSSELTVNVDGIRKSWVQSDVNSLMDEIQAPLYVGGLPDNAPSGTLKIKENFKGCIRKLKIEDTLMDWTDMKELNNVLLNACPVVSV